ncbi:MAG: hypothetical protein LCH54_13785 [Bacteroidetes bacterium]|nr:hypothetical protein [Bacteroidota bacterium]
MLFNATTRHLIGLICISSFFACSSDDDKDGVPNEKDKCPGTPIGTVVDKNGCPVIREIGNVHFYIETSASMGGYFKQDADFKTLITDISTKIEKNIKPLDIWFIADSATKYEGNSQKLSRDIATTRIADKKSSELHEIFSQIAEKNDSNDVSILISDCILSFPDSEIMMNREINKQEAPNSLKGNIFSTFSDMQKKGIGTSVYAFTSKFYGTYYNYQNGRSDLNGARRPFYMWVIGDKEVLRKFNSQLKDISSFRPEKSLHFGIYDDPVTTYNIIPQIERKGNWMKTGSGIKDIEIVESEPITFCAVLNLESLPEYSTTTQYLKENLQLETVGCQAEFEIREKSTLDKSKLKSEQQIALFEQATHALVFTLTEMSLSEAKINLTLPYKSDLWYLDWSCLDDKNLSGIDGKTFAFEYLVAGVKEAYETKNKNFIDFSVTLNK